MAQNLEGGRSMLADHPAAGYYDRYWTDGVSGWHPSAGLSDSLRALLGDLCSGQTVLDYGGGDGERYGQFLQGVARRVVVADVSPAAVEANRRAGREAVTVDEVGSADVEFDVLVMLEVLEHLLDPKRVLEQALGAVRPGGTAILSVPNAFSWWNRARMLAGRLPASGVGAPGVRGHTYDAPHIRFFDVDSFRNLAAAAGLEVMSLSTDALELWKLKRFAPDRLWPVSPRTALAAATLIAVCRKP